MGSQSDKVIRANKELIGRKEITDNFKLTIRQIRSIFNDSKYDFPPIVLSSSGSTIMYRRKLVDIWHSENLELIADILKTDADKHLANSKEALTLTLMTNFAKMNKELAKYTVKNAKLANVKALYIKYAA